MAGCLVMQLGLLSCARAPQESPEDVLALGIDTYRSSGPKDAIPDFTRALEGFRKAGNKSGEGRALSALGNATKAAGDVDAGIALLREALAIHQSLGADEEAGKVLNNLGLAYHAAARYGEAAAALDEAQALAKRLGDRRLEGAVLNNAGMVRDEIGDYRGALDRYERALAASRAVGFDRLTSDALGNIGGVHLLLGRFGAAAASYREAYALSERLDLGPGMSKDLGNLAASLLGAGELDESLHTYDRALTKAREGGLVTDEADWQLGRGRVLSRLGNYDGALQAYEASLRLYEAGELPRERIDALLERGGLLLAMGSDEAAQRDFAAAREAATAIGYPRGQTRAALAIGDLESRRTRFDAAIDAYTKAIDGAIRAGELAIAADAQVMRGRVLLATERRTDARTAAVAAQTSARELGAREIEARALHLLVAVARAEGRTEEGLQLCQEAGTVAVVEQTAELRWRQAYELGRLLEQAGRLDAAAAALTRAVATLEQIRAELRDDRFRGGYLLDKQEAYAALVRVLIRLGRADAALDVSETLRAHWQLSNASVGQVSSAETPRAAELRRRIQKLQHEHDVEVSRPVHEQRRGALAVFSEEIKSAQREYATETGKRRNTEVARVQTADAIRRTLSPSTALVEFVIGRDDSAVFLLTRDRITAHMLGVGGRDLQVRIELLRDLLERRPHSDAWLGPAAALARILLPPSVRPGRAISRLILVPNGVLHYLPFAVLPIDGEGRELLFDRFELAYVPTASSIVGAGRRSAGADMLALAPARPGLRHTATEVRELSQLHRGTTMLVGEAATESAFKASAGQYDILHLATHGFFNRTNPLFSGVILEPTREDDGRLEVHEILRLPLRASLVTLSACRTGLGGGQVADVPPGDDFVGLTRAFLAAGSGAVLATLWDLDDEGAVSLMREFYGRLSGQGPHRALREAQRAMRASGGRFAHPYYWAGLVLVTPSAGGS